MGKQTWKAGNMLYPLPAVLVSVADKAGKQNLFTVAWTGTVCSDPPMVSISVRPERYSYHMIEETGEFVINLTTEKLAYATDGRGSRVDGVKISTLKENAICVAVNNVGTEAGSYSVRCCAVDASGNKSPSYNIKITVVK